MPALPYSEEVFQLLVESVEEYAICALDVEGHIVHWNTGAARILGFTEEEVLGQPLALVFTEADRQAGIPEQELRIAIQQGRAEDERWHVRKDGSRFWAIGVLVPVKDADGALVGFGKILRDRTDLKEIQDTLRNRATALAAADEDKNVFLATLAHELRNPLAALAGGIALIKKADVPERIRTIAELMERHVVLSTRLVNDVLDIARVERSKLQLQREPLDVCDLVKQAVDTITPAMKERQHELAVDVPSRSLIISGDRHRVLQILVNLLSNAAKFTLIGGKVTITATVEDNEAVVRVLDTGMGIPPDKLASIFDLFSQAHPSLPGSQAGLGIGLALTRDLVALHEGTIQVRSRGLGEGSEFIVRLPLLSNGEGIKAKPR